MYVYVSFQIKLSSEEEQVVRDAFKGEPSVENLFYAISTTAYTGKKSESVYAKLVS